MEHQSILFHPIGTIKTPYIDKAPYQPYEDKLSRFEVEIFPEFEEGLQGIESFSYLMLFFYLDRTEMSGDLIVDVSWANIETGVFSTRSPDRPNPIGFSIVKLLEREGNILRISGVDAFDNTPLLDIKPYILELDSKKDANNGWVDDLDDKEHMSLHLRGIPH
jgi:tRNA-Thr(GGU) m(6)t(6)A37 methyltransferase TsaA